MGREQAIGTLRGLVQILGDKGEIRVTPNDFQVIQNAVETLSAPIVKNDKKSK